MTERHDGDETVSSSDFRRHIFDISEPVFHVNPPNPQKLFAFQSGDNVRLGLFSAEPIPAANHWAGIDPGEGTGPSLDGPHSTHTHKLKPSLDLWRVG